MIRASSGCRLVALVGAAISCGPPGMVVDLYNDTPHDVIVEQGYNDASIKSDRLAPGSGAEFGPAVTWRVSFAGTRVELRHPGDEFAERRPVGRQVFRFQIEPPGCIFALSPDQRAPVVEFATQPSGYPLGPADTCTGQGERTPMQESTP